MQSLHSAIGARGYADLTGRQHVAPFVQTPCSVLTREEKLTAIIVSLESVLGLSCGYRQTPWRPLLWFFAGLIIIAMMIVFAAGVQLQKVSGPWRPRMLLVLVGVITLPLAPRAGVKIADLDFKYRRKQQYEALIATTKVPPEGQGSDAVRVAAPADLGFDDLPVWAWRQSGGQLVVEFVWSRHIRYVYCGGHGCDRDTQWRSTRGLDKHWFMAYP